MGGAVADGGRHGVLGCLRGVIVDEGNPLPIFVLGQAHLVEPVELREDLFELLFGDVLRDVANVEGKHIGFSRRGRLRV